ncbi:ABC-type nickel/cobalt efflux system, permease component RcnA [Bradyrhizobium erythrophlei]|uniref:Nickel/cobalt efflux system n=1 Tax=Bradyrhizobium erythrophlei TaxID=1437360 RepID=A0A1M7U7E3_9BRAD|nr:ABC-type nickel/cobalt efflux system, permease component RcnA [Bradyrhizobium erythrophlei]
MKPGEGTLRLSRALAVGALAVAAVLAADGVAHIVAAQTPFGGVRPPATEQSGGLIGWLLAKQSEFYREMSSTIRAAKSDGSAVWGLLAISFAYGIFHAAGPGHGKAVISSYLVANQETAKRGIVLSFVSAMLQSLVAVLIVAIGAWLLNITAKTMCGAERVIAIASYGLIAAFGARLVWTKGAGFIRALQAHSPGPELALASASHGHVHHHDHDHSHDGPHDHAHRDHAHHDHGHDHVHVHDEHCGHSHGPMPGELAGPGGWSRGLSAIFAVGLRPCSGAILVLVFALAQGLFWAGIAATFVMGLGTAITVAAIAVLAVTAKGIAHRISGASDGRGALVMRGIEFAAAGLVLLFGIGLLTGYLFAEPLTCLQPIL